MGIAPVLSVSAYLGVFGNDARAFSALIALIAAFVAAPLIAWATGGVITLHKPGPAMAGVRQCVICEREGADDLARCPATSHICSLCCSLDARCNDLCKPRARLSPNGPAPCGACCRAVWPYLESGLGHHLLLMGGIAPGLALLVWLLHHLGLKLLGDSAGRVCSRLQMAFLKGYAGPLCCCRAWWWVAGVDPQEP